MTRCPICLKPPMEGIEPFCSADCLHADPATGKDPDLRRRLATWEERQTGAGGPGGMVSSAGPLEPPRVLGWYLAGAQDEAATQLSVPELFAALMQDIDAFVAYLSAHDVEHRRLNFGPPQRDGVRFAVGDEYWAAEFYDNGKFKQLAWAG